MKFDYIIIGCGVIGTSTAYHLKLALPEASILLIDKNDRIGTGNTAKSAALFRNLFSSSINYQLADNSIRFYQTIKEELKLKSNGYLWLFSKEYWEASQNKLKKMDPNKYNYRILQTEQILKLLNINTRRSGHFNDVFKGILGHSCGSLSAMKIARFYASEFEKLGGEIKLKSEITSFSLSGRDLEFAPWVDKRVDSVTDHLGNRFKSSEFIIATGAWTTHLLSPLGIYSGILPKKRQLFGLKIKDTTQLVRNINPANVPILILPTGGVYIKPVLEKKAIIVGAAVDLGEPYILNNPESPEGNSSYFFRAIEPILTHYFRDLSDYELIQKWAGYYADYWPDKHPVIERVSNIVWVSGTSGSGIMKADSIGRIAAAEAQKLEQATLFDGTPFIVKNLSLLERNVQREGFII